MDKRQILQSKIKQAKAKAVLADKRHKEQVLALVSVKNAIIELHELINGQEKPDFDSLTKHLASLDALIDLKEPFSQIAKALNKKSVTPEDFSKLAKAILDNKPTPVKIDISKLEKAILEVNQRIQEQTEQADSRSAEDYKPFRRVIKAGNRFVYDDQPTPSRGGGGSSSSSASSGLTDAELRASPVEVDARADPSYYQGTVSATAVNVVGLIDGASFPVLELQHRGTSGQFKFTILVEGTDDSTATGDETAGAASTVKGWTSLEVRSATGGEMSSILLGGRYLLYNPPRKIRIRCSAYTFGTAEIFVMAKPVSQQDPSRTISDKDALASLAMTTFGQMQVAERTFLTGANFDAASLDTDTWENINSGTGSHTFANGFIELHTGTNASGKGGVRSLNVANVLGAADNAITMRTSLGSITDGQYVYRFGPYSDTEGTFIQFGGNARTITDAVFNATTTMTSATAAFTAADLGRRVTSSGNVTIGTNIVKIVSATEVLLSAAALTTASAQTVDIEGFNVSYVNRKAGVDTTSTFGVIGFAAVTPSANALQLWEMTFNPNFLIIRLSGNFVQLQIGSSVLAPMFSEYDLPLTAEAINLGSTTDHTLYLQTLTAERLGQPASIRADSSFMADDVLEATASIIHGRQPDGDFVGIKADGTVLTNTSTLLAGATYTSAWIDTDGWATAELFIATDQVSGTNGIEIEFTDDVQAGTPTERGNRFYTFTADDLTRGFAVFRFPTELDGLRIKYTNGGTNQGSFFISLNLRVGASAPQASLEANVNATNVAAMMRSLLMARNDSGTYGNVTRGTSGGLRTSINQHEVETPIKSLATLKNTRTTVGTSAVEITSSSPLTGRRSVSIKAICSGSNFVYIGSSSAVTTSNGYPLANEQSLDLEVDATTLIWAIASAASQAVAILELGT